MVHTLGGGLQQIGSQCVGREIVTLSPTASSRFGLLELPQRRHPLRAAPSSCRRQQMAPWRRTGFESCFGYPLQLGMLGRIQAERLLCWRCRGGGRYRNTWRRCAWWRGPT